MNESKVDGVTLRGLLRAVVAQVADVLSRYLAAKAKAVRATVPPVLL